MQYIKNEYQIQKTLRFGLVLKEKKSKDGREIKSSHSELKHLIDISINRIKGNVSTQMQKSSLPIEKIHECVDSISKLSADWINIISKNSNDIALDKDFYKKLSKRIGFNGTKCPKSREIKMVELDSETILNGKTRKYYIIEYWINLGLLANEKYIEVSDQIKQYENAVKQNRNDNKPNEVDLKKSFLSLANIVMEILRPLYYKQISFPTICKTTNRKLIDFVDDKNNSRRGLMESIETIKDYFSDNGSNVLLCRASLDPAYQLNTRKNGNKSPDNKEIIDKIGIKTILKNNIEDYLNSPAEKKIKTLENDENLIRRALMFKSIQIPVSVRYEIARILVTDSDLDMNEADILDRLEEICKTRIPHKDYADLKDKSEFDIEKYPLKEAFNYAWEGLARSMYHPESDFPIEKSKNFLKTHFYISDSSKDFIMYSKLLELNALLSTLDNNKPEEEKSEVERESALILISELMNDKDLKKQKGYLKICEDHLKKIENIEYKSAKLELSKHRGTLKGKIKKYHEIASKNKDLSQRLGGFYSQIRDNLARVAELNRISHRAMIIEDSNSDKYVLIQEISSAKDSFLNPKIGNNDLKTYCLTSETSASISASIYKRVPESINREHDYNLKRKKKEDWIKKEWGHVLRNLNINIKNFWKKDLEQIKKVVDSKLPCLKTGHISTSKLEMLVKDNECLLLPIVNQDIAKEVKSDNNQFTKDWNAIFNGSGNWRLLPELKIMYKKPTPDYPVDITGDKRNSRFQINGHFLCNYIPKSNSYISVREQLDNFRDEDKQKNAVINFNNRVIRNIPANNFYVFGIDRGQKELATLCVIDNRRKIITGFDIYTREFNSNTKQWEHKHLEKRNILDLSNLRVETTITIDGNPDSRQVLVDQSSIKVKYKRTNEYRTNMLQIKMQQLAYIRKLQYKMQTDPDTVIEWFNANNTEEKISENFIDKQNGEKGLVSFYGTLILREELKESLSKAGKKATTAIVLKDILPIERIKLMCEEFCKLKEKEKNGENVTPQLDRLIELNPADSLKRGVVANMVGVIAFLLKKFNYKVFISLEDLSDPHETSNGLTDVQGNYFEREGRRAIVEKYAGLGLYNYFEMQLLRKLFRIQQDNGDIIHLVPAFRAQRNYDNLITTPKEKIRSQFGIVFFIDPDSTSIACPRCGANNNNNYEPDYNKYPNAQKVKRVWVKRDKDDDDRIHCYVCNFDTQENYHENPIGYIKSGDDNAAYLISEYGIKAYENAYNLAVNLLDNINK